MFSNPPDTQTAPDKLEGVNIPEFHAKVREAVDYLNSKVGGKRFASVVTIYRSTVNRREFYVFAPRLHNIEPIVTIKTGAGWDECTSPLTQTAACVNTALGYYWRAVSAYFPAGNGAPVLAKKGEKPKGGKLIVTATPHPAGFSK